MSEIYEMYFSIEDNRVYYYNTKTKRSSWDIPSKAQVIDKRTEEQRKAHKQLTETTSPYAHLFEKYNEHYNKKRLREANAAIIKKNKGRVCSQGGLYFLDKVGLRKIDVIPQANDGTVGVIANANKNQARGQVKNINAACAIHDSNERRDWQVNSGVKANESQKSTMQGQIKETPKEEVKWRFKSQEVETMMRRPARKQIQSIQPPITYQEDNTNYNIWYDKYQTVSNSKERVGSLYKCIPELDTGYTRADTMGASSFFCVYFARGCCIEGSGCNYFHRVPQPEDLIFEDNARDVFGRARHATFKRNMAGVGCFLNNTRTVVVSNVRANNVAGTPVVNAVKLLYDQMAKWGEIEFVKVLSQKAKVKMRYKHRYNAEFAKEAMQDQSFAEVDVIDVRWDLENGFDKEEEQRTMFTSAINRVASTQAELNAEGKKALEGLIRDSKRVD